MATDAPCEYFTEYEGKQWLVDDVSGGVKTLLAVTERKQTVQTTFQKLEIIDLVPFGTCLVLDGKMQSAHFDEHTYHESLVQPALLNHPNPRTVFIEGGGEGATLRECLRFKTVEKVTMVDIDGDCVEACRKFLPEHSAGAFDDPRTHLVIADAKKYLEDHEDKYDVIISDLCDPSEGGPATALYTVDFFRFILTRLNPGGIFLVQSGPGGVVSMHDCMIAIHHTLKQVFPTVIPYTTFVPSFNDMWAYNICFTDASQKLLSNEEIDKKIAERVTGENHFLDGIGCQGLFGVAKSLRVALSKATDADLITPENPRFIFTE